VGLLNSIFEWLVAFGAGFFGHVVAHDFCVVTPMISEKIMEAAASHLPASIRERYCEEWRADLRDQHGALAKLTWSFGCFISALRCAGMSFWTRHGEHRSRSPSKTAKQSLSIAPRTPFLWQG
jgi:hypothetical protein